MNHAVAAALAGPAVLQFGPAVAGMPGVTSRLPGGWARGRHLEGMALTFDDGPHPEGTPTILKILARYGVSATFFVIGEQLRGQEDLGRRIVAEGHELAVHGWNHSPLPLQSPRAAARRLVTAAALVADIADAAPTWFRPPYGLATAGSLLEMRALRLRPIWWTRWARDWSARATPDSVLARSTRRLRDREVLLLHDSDRYARPESWRTTAAALPGILDFCAANGHRVGSLRSLTHPHPAEWRRPECADPPTLGRRPLGPGSGSRLSLPS